VIAAFPDVQVLDVTGPAEVFSQADRASARGEYAIELVTSAGEPVQASSGIRLVPDGSLERCRGPIDTLVVAGGAGVRQAAGEEWLISWLRLAARRARRVASVCTGAYFLAEAGLLDGLRATTHWASCAELARRYPGVSVEPDTIFVREGYLYTSAGVTAGMDLALAMVEEDHGRDVALAVARELVMFLRRPGGQSQFSAQLKVQLAEHVPLQELQAYILEHPEADLSVPALARRVAMSPRNFARAFAREVGMTPARFVASARIETARRLLEETSDGLEAIVAKTGLGTAESMRRLFLRHVGVAPGQYRERFSRSSGRRAV